MEQKIKNNKAWRLWPLIPAVIGFLIFMPGAAYPFYPEWDDGGFVSLNPHMVPSWENALYWLTHDTQTVYTPMPMWSLMLDRWLFGLNPVGFHLHNMLLHGIAASLLYGLLRHLKISCKWACLVAVLWAIHPQRIESVVWITERKDVLAGVFSFAAMLLFMRGCDREKISWSAVIMTCLAMGSKPSTLLLPGIMAAYILYKRRDFKVKKYLKLLWPYVILVIAFYIIFSLISSRAGLTPIPESWPRMPLVPIHNLCWYILTALIPFELNPLYPRVYTDARTYYVLVGGLLLLALPLCILKQRLKRENWLYDVVPIVVAWGCLFMPISALFRFTNTDYCDRYNYLPAAVIMIAAALFFKYWMPGIFKKRHKLFTLLVVLAGVTYMGVSLQYIFSWRSSRALFLRALEVRHPNPKVWVGLAEIALNNDDANLMQKAGYGLIQVSREKDLYLVDSQTCANTGTILMGIGYGLKTQYKKAFLFLDHARTACSYGEVKVYTPKMLLPRYWLVLTDCYLQQRNPKEAVKCLLKYQAIPWLAPADRLFAAGLQAYLTGYLDNAIAAWSKASALRPEDTRIEYNLQRAKHLLLKRYQNKK